MPTVDDVYRKFGEVSEAAQLLETNLVLIFVMFGVVEESLKTPDVKEGSAEETDLHVRIDDLMCRINSQTLGRLMKKITKRHTKALDQLQPFLFTALKERNRLNHSFYRRHSFRKLSDAGRATMMKELESIHQTLIEAVKALSLHSGIDFDTLYEQAKILGERIDSADEADDAPSHEPI
jgi:hypothetical protein